MNDSKLPTDEKNVRPMDSKKIIEAQAKDIIHGKKSPPLEILGLAKKLKNYKSFSYARRILERAANDETVNQDKKSKLVIFQQWALCTYKDDDLPIDSRLDKALKILEEVEDIDTTKDQETLGIIGAIYKRKWEVDNQKMQLERALLYYRRGYQEGAEKDYGYTGINVAFVLDWLAFQEESEARTAKIESLAANQRRERAQEIRRDIIAKVTPLANDPKNAWLKDSWWYYGTIAEAHFGLREYDRAVECFEEGRKNIGEIPEWEEESTLQQLARLAVFQGNDTRAGREFEGTPASDTLYRIFGKYPAAIRNAFSGKIGLALSGGGFRASLYHIGTLAKLAELDVLRQIEVLSCVSGGSIIGAHYYLKVRKLLEAKQDMRVLDEENDPQKDDQFISRADYIKIVEEIIEEFLEGVQRNVRMRLAAEFKTNLKMLFFSNYSRTMRAGELYEEEIFSKIHDGEGGKPRFMNELNIYPKDDIENFNPKLNNWRRAAKVPMLVLNAATLNTGHNWQFTTTWMGEPPSSIDTEVDTNDRLRRMYYKEAPEDHRKIRLGHAVSASAAVPGLFEPLAFEDLYPDRTVRLVDGGVCDNQGINSLLEQDCTVILVSDGSGQMISENRPSNGLIGVPLRSNSILQSRIRDVQYHDLERRKRSSLLRGLMFIHLKEDLASDPIDWVDCPDPGNQTPRRFLADYGIAKDIQQCLAAMRTDLDSFSDIEAYALMTSAYRMTENAFKNKKCIDGFSDRGKTVKWKFLKIEDSLKTEGKSYGYVKKILGTSNNIAFKVWRQSSVLKYAAWALGVVLAAFVVWLFFNYWQSELLSATITVGGVGKWLVGIAAAALAVYLVGFFSQVIFWRNTLARIAIGLGMCLFGWIAARIHLLVFDKIFLKRGNLDSLPPGEKS
jgi:predicted acylesterase/phospholipase RssA